MGRNLPAAGRPRKDFHGRWSFTVGATWQFRLSPLPERVTIAARATTTTDQMR